MVAYHQISHASYHNGFIDRSWILNSLIVVILYSVQILAKQKKMFQYVFINLDFKRPFFSSYVKLSLLTVYLLHHQWKRCKVKSKNNFFYNQFLWNFYISMALASNSHESKLHLLVIISINAFHDAFE